MIIDSHAHIFPLLGGAAGFPSVREHMLFFQKYLAQPAQAVRRVAIAPRTRRLSVPGPIVFARGLEIRLTVEEAGFAGASAFLLGAVLEQFLGRLASMNTFTELVLVSETRGEIKRWPPRMAARPLA